MKTKLRAMASAFAFAVTLLLSQSAFAQIWQVGDMVMTFTDASRGNRQIETRIFYPADVGGSNVPMGSPSDKRFPLLVFGHDVDIDWTHYSYLWEQLVNKGFILAIPTTEMGANPNVDELARDMAFIAEQFSVMRVTLGSFFFYRYNTRACMMGHGTGGAAATIAMQYYPQARTYISLAATETVPSAINAATLITQPSVVISGNEDCVSPLASNQLLLFNNIDADCKTWINIYTATHCHFGMNANTCTASETFCYGTSVGLPQVTQFNTTYLLISFLRYYMKDNAPAFNKFVWKLSTKTNDWMYTLSCNSPRTPETASTTTPDVSRFAEEQTLGMILYPNPVVSGNSVTMDVGSEDESGVRVMIHNLMGQMVYDRDLPIEETMSRISIPTTGLSKGRYVVSVMSHEGRVTRPLIIQ